MHSFDLKASLAWLCTFQCVFCHDNLHNPLALSVPAKAGADARAAVGRHHLFPRAGLSGAGAISACAPCAPHYGVVADSIGHWVLCRLQSSMLGDLALCDSKLADVINMQRLGNAVCPTQAAVVQQLPELLDQNPKARACTCMCTNAAFRCCTTTELRQDSSPGLLASRILISRPHARLKHEHSQRRCGW